MEETVVYLVGFMGCGKTSVGGRLARRLGWSFIDLDAAIEERAGESIRRIFSVRGESCFREIEREELRRVSRLHAVVVALGGGAFCTEENRRIVESTGLSVWLDAPMEVLLARCAVDDTRPLFTTAEELAALLKRRIPFYEKADIRLDVGGLTVDAAAEQIHRRLEKRFRDRRRE